MFPAAALATVLAVAPEIDIVAQSLRPDQRARVEAAVGGLDKLPLYRMELIVDPAARTVTGQEQIVVPAGPGPLGEVFLRTYANAAAFGRGEPVRVAEVRVAGAEVTPERPDPTVLRVPIVPAVPPGGSATVDVLFRVELPPIADAAGSLDAAAFGALASFAKTASPKTDHGALGSSRDVVNLGGFFPVVAPRTGGLFDTRVPSGVGDPPGTDPSNFVVSVLAPAAAVVAGVGVEVGRVPAASGQARTTLVAAAVRDFALFLSEAYVEASGVAGPVTVRAYTLKADADEGRRVLDSARAALAHFADRFGPYPWVEFKLAQCPLTGGAGGVEYPTLVGVASMLYHARGSRIGGLFGAAAPGARLADAMLEGAVAHEVAHQWWMAIVGSDPQAHPWVDESLAQYSAALLAEHRRGAKGYEAFLKAQVIGNYHAYRLAGGADAPAARPAGAFENEHAYGGLVYGKAAAFHRAARRLLGDKAFFAGLRRYAERHAFRRAGPADLAAAVAEVAPSRARAYGDLSRRWLEAAHGDEDLGKPDLAGMVSAMSGAPVDPATRAALEQLLPILEEALRGGGLPFGAAPDDEP